MYIYLSPDIIRSPLNSVHYSSLGREATTFSDIEYLRELREKSKIIVFFDSSVDFQMLDNFRLILDLEYIFVVKTQEDYDVVSAFYKTLLMNYSSINGLLIKAIVHEDQNIIEEFQNTQEHNLDSVPKELAQDVVNSFTEKETNKRVAGAYLNMHTAYEKSETRRKELEQKNLEQLEELSILRGENSKLGTQLSTFVDTFQEKERNLRSISALSIIRELSPYNLPQDKMILYMKDYGMPNKFKLIEAIHSASSVLYKKYTKVLVIADTNDLDINLIPRDYLIIHDQISSKDLLRAQYIASVGTYTEVLDNIFQTSAIDALVICDMRRLDRVDISGETLYLNLVPDNYTQMKLELNPEITVNPSGRAKYQFKEELFTDKDSDPRHTQLVNNIMQELLDRKGGF